MSTAGVVRVTGVTPEDFSAYVAARGPSLQRFAYLASGGSADSSDLVQDALEKAYPRWRGLVRSGTHDAYVRRCIVNGSVSRWRKLGRVVPVEEPGLYGAAAAPDPADSDADAAWSLCLSLPPTQRAAVVLRFYEDLSFAQIAVILDCADATARSHVHRALATLRARLTQKVDDE